MIVAEVGSNWHSLEDLHESVVAAAQAGADAVKFQVWDELYNRERAPHQWKITQQYRLSLRWLNELLYECRSSHIQFHLTIFNPRLYDELEIAPDAIKIASGDLTYLPLIDKAARFSDWHGIPLVLSTGTHTQKEVDDGIAYAMGITDNLIILNCVSLYPAKEELYDLQWMMRYRGMAGLGISDHTMGYALAAQAAGMASYAWFEKHFRLNHISDTPDAPHSLTPSQFSQYVEVIRAMEKRFEADKVVHPAEALERNWMHRGVDGLRPVQ